MNYQHILKAKLLGFAINPIKPGRARRLVLPGVGVVRTPVATLAP